MPSTSIRLNARKRATELGFAVHKRLPEEDLTAAREVGTLVLRVAVLSREQRAHVFALLDRMEQLPGRLLGEPLLYLEEDAVKHEQRDFVEVGEGGEHPQRQCSRCRISRAEGGQ